MMGKDEIIDHIKKNTLITQGIDCVTDFKILYNSKCPFCFDNTVITKSSILFQLEEAGFEMKFSFQGVCWIAYVYAWAEFQNQLLQVGIKLKIW